MDAITTNFHSFSQHEIDVYESAVYPTTYVHYSCRHEMSAYIYREYDLRSFLCVHFSAIIPQNLTGDHTTSWESLFWLILTIKQNHWECIKVLRW